MARWGRQVLSASSHGGKPPQLVHAESQKRMRPERADLDNQSHRDRGRMPARGSEAFQRRSLGSSLVEMKGLGIELRRKAFDVFARNQLIGTFKEPVVRDVLIAAARVG